MSFKTNNAVAESTTNDSWKAKGFINFYLPTKDGGRKKVGAIPLKAAKPNEVALAEYLESDPEVNGKNFMNRLVMEYVSAEPTVGSAYDLPV